MENYYKVLQVADFAEIEVIKASYKALSKKYHPDVNANCDSEIMVRINNAYDILKDEDKKREYDIALKNFLKQDNNINENKKEERERSHTSSRNFNNVGKISIFSITIRFFISFILSVIFGMFGSYLILTFIPIDGSWSFIAYSIYGGMIGSIFSYINKETNNFIAITAVIVTIICMLFPYYEYLYQTLPMVYNTDLSLFVYLRLATKEVIDLLLCSGFLRMIFVVLAPLLAYQYAIDE